VVNDECVWLDFELESRKTDPVKRGEQGMKNSITRIGLATALVATSLATAAPAEARGHYYRHYRGGGDDAAIAIGAGIIGLALGAAIASNHDDDYYYPDGYNGYYDYPAPYGYYYYNSYPRYRVYRYPDRYYRGYYGNRWDRGYARMGGYYGHHWRR
jgi:hypothetical protein